MFVVWPSSGSLGQHTKQLWAMMILLHGVFYKMWSLHCKMCWLIFPWHSLYCLLIYHVIYIYIYEYRVSHSYDMFHTCLARILCFLSSSSVSINMTLMAAWGLSRQRHAHWGSIWISLFMMLLWATADLAYYMDGLFQNYSISSALGISNKPITLPNWEINFLHQICRWL